MQTKAAQISLLRESTFHFFLVFRVPSISCPVQSRSHWRYSYDPKERLPELYRRRQEVQQHHFALPGTILTLPEDGQQFSTISDEDSYNWQQRFDATNRTKCCYSKTSLSGRFLPPGCGAVDFTFSRLICRSSRTRKILLFYDQFVAFTCVYQTRCRFPRLERSF